MIPGSGRFAGEGIGYPVFLGLHWASWVALVVKNPPANAGYVRDVVQSLGQEDSLEEGMAAHSSVLSWRVSWTEEPAVLQSIRSKRVEHD